MIVSIIIPIFNEKNSFDRLLGEVLASSTAPYQKEILVIDDGSTDGSGDMLAAAAGRNPCIKVLRHARNVGKAASIRTGLQAATGDLVLIQDGDLEYSPSDYPLLLRPFSDTAVVAVYGSRFLEHSWPHNMKAVHWLANKLFTSLTNILYHTRLTDEGTAYKAFRRDTLCSLNIESSGFEFCPEVTSKLLKRHARIVEVPVSYRARSKREGKKPKLHDGLKILWTIVKYRFIR